MKSRKMYHTDERRYEHIKIWCEDLKERNHQEDIDADVRNNIKIDVKEIK
jgi:hypothetical protein